MTRSHLALLICTASAFVLALLALTLSWKGTSEPVIPVQDVAPAQASAPTSTELARWGEGNRLRDGSALLPARVGSGSRSRPEPTASEPAAPEKAAEEDSSKPDRPETYPLFVRYVLSNGDTAYPERGTLVLERPRDSAYGPQTISVRLDGGASDLVPLPLGPWELRVVNSGFLHLAETIAATPTTLHGAKHEITLWGQEEIPVRVRTPDRLSVSALADALGWEQKSFLYRAFAFRTSHEPFTQAVQQGPAPSASDEAPSTSFRRPYSGYDKALIGRDIVGFLLRRDEGPHWIGLWVHDQFHSAQQITHATRELIFVVGLEERLGRIAQVLVKVVDRASNDPISVGVKATLKVNHAPHRRNDQLDRSPNAKGELSFKRVLPGTYDLLIERRTSYAQRRVKVRPGASIDLGVIALGDGPALALMVVNDDGRSVDATIEVADYQAGRSIDDLFPPNVFRHTGEDGKCLLPIPDRPCLLRAVFRPGDHVLLMPGVQSAVILLDPAALPSKLSIAVKEPLHTLIRCASPLDPDHRIDFYQPDLDLLVRTVRPTPRAARPGLWVEMIPGTYLATHRDGDGKVIGSKTVRVIDMTFTLLVP